MLDDLMDEIKNVKPFVVETNTTLQRMEEKLSNLESRVLDVEQRISEVQDAAAKMDSMAKEILRLKKQTNDLENQKRRNDLRIYGIPENAEGTDNFFP